MTVTQLIHALQQIERPDTTVVVVSEAEITEMGTEYVDLSYTLAQD